MDELLGKVILEFDETAIDRLGRLMDDKIAPLLERIEQLERAVEAAQSRSYGYVPPPVYG